VPSQLRVLLYLFTVTCGIVDAMDKVEDSVVRAVEGRCRAARAAAAALGRGVDVAVADPSTKQGALGCGGAGDGQAGGQAEGRLSAGGGDGDEGMVMELGAALGDPLETKAGGTAGPTPTAAAEAGCKLGAGPEQQMAGAAAAQQPEDGRVTAKAWLMFNFGWVLRSLRVGSPPTAVFFLGTLGSLTWCA
jgi:hypothetical protein